MRYLIGAAAIAFALIGTPAFAAEHLVNGDLSQNGPENIPPGWHKGGYGEGARTLFRAYSSDNGLWFTRAWVATGGTGNVKWYSDDVPVTAGQTFVLSDRFHASGISNVTLRYLIGGQYKYMTLNTIQQTFDDTFYKYRRTFTVPAGATALSVWHSINADADQPAFIEVGAWSLADPVPFSPSLGQNLIRNADLAELDPNGRLAYWSHIGIANLTRCGSITPGNPCPVGTVAIGFRADPSNSSIGSSFADLAPGTGRKVELSHSGDGTYRVQLEFKTPGGAVWAKSFAGIMGWATDTRSFDVPDSASQVRVWFTDTDGSVAYIQNVALIQK